MKHKTTVAVIVTFILASFFYIPMTAVLAEQSGNTPNSGVVSRIKSVYDSLVSLGHGSDSEGSWGNWGSMWNRIRSAGEWTPSGDALESEVVAGKTYYKDSRTAKTGTLLLTGDADPNQVVNGATFYNNSFTKQTGTLALTGDALVSEVTSGKTFYSNSFTKLTGTAPAPFDYSTQSNVIWDDYKNDGSADGDNAGEESTWTNTAGNATTGVWKDTRTGLYWSANQGSFTNLFTVATCDFFTSNPRGSYLGGDSDCGNAINHCANLSLDANGDGLPETNWYLPTQKELMQAYLNGIYNKTSTTFVTTDWFWSSSEVSFNASYAWFTYLYRGSTSNYDKTVERTSRCVVRD